MARRLFAALALAHSATALFGGFVDVLVQVDEFRIPANLLDGTLHAAGSDDSGDSDNGYEACETANAAISACYYADYLDPAVAAADVDRCVCCDGTTGASAVYSSCASWALGRDTDDATSIYSVASQIYSVCATRIDCRATGPARTISVEPFTSSIDLPPACSSLGSIYGSCAANPSFYTAANTDVAACFCPEEDGKINKSFQSYASACAPFARSSFPSDYSIITRLQTFCDAYQPVTDAESLVFSTVGTRTGPGFGLPSITPSANNALPNSGESSESAETASSSTGAGARGLAVPGFMTWLIEVATLLLSFFIML
ncbi:hypothetical protein P885DRAFT_37140 [Corynascus similis CBS 632.67]